VEIERTLAFPPQMVDLFLGFEVEMFFRPLIYGQQG
jgi:hypothetical protein